MIEQEEIRGRKAAQRRFFDLAYQLYEACDRRKVTYQGKKVQRIVVSFLDLDPGPNHRGQSAAANLGQATIEPDPKWKTWHDDEASTVMTMRFHKR